MGIVFIFIFQKAKNANEEYFQECWRR